MSTIPKNILPSLFNSLLAVSILCISLSVSAHARSINAQSAGAKKGWISNNLKPACIPNRLPIDVVIRASQNAPQRGELVVNGVDLGGQVMDGTTSTPFVAPDATLPYDGTHRIRMIYRPKDVTLGKTKDYIDITINCESHMAKNGADYKESCSLNTTDPKVTNVGLLGYESTMTIRNGTDSDFCPGQKSMAFRYTVKPDIENYAKRVWVILNAVGDQSIDDKFKPGFQDLFNYWVAGFAH